MRCCTSIPLEQSSVGSANLLYLPHFCRTMTISSTIASRRSSPRRVIGIDASRAVLAQRTGTEHYSASLLRALSELPEARERPATLYVNLRNPQSAIRNLQFDLPPAWRVRAIPFPRLWTHLRLSWEMLTRPPRTLFVPSHVVPLWHPRRTVVTIHDLGYL